MSPVDPSRPDLSHQQMAEVVEVLQAVCPLETELLGPTTVENILAGADFKPVHGGRHIDLSVVISLVSCVAGLTQLAIKVWEMRRPEKDRDAAKAALAEGERRARAAISEYLSLHVEFAQVLARHPEYPEQVVVAVRRIRSHSGDDGIFR